MSQTDDFIATLSQTPPLAQQLLDQLNQANSDLQQAIDVLNYSKELDDDLGTLSDALNTTLEILEVVEVIPEVGEAAAPLAEAVTALNEEVQPAKSAADNIEAEVAPFRDALSHVQAYLQELINALTDVQSGSQTFLTDFTAVVNCINGLPDGTYKTQGQQYLDQFSGAAQPEVAALNDGMNAAYEAIKAFFYELDQLVAALSPLQAISSAIDQVLSVLNPVIDLLSQLQSALEDIKIVIWIPYPQSVSLYDIFRDFGQFADLAMTAIQGLVDDLLSALNIQLPDIPGLSDLINLDINIPGVPDFSSILTAITNPFSALQQLIPTFNLKCPPDSSDDQVPGGGTYQR